MDHSYEEIRKAAITVISRTNDGSQFANLKAGVAHLFQDVQSLGGAATTSLAERLRTHRERLGLSRKRLAALLGTDPSNVAGWETETHRPTKKSLQIIDTFLNADDPLRATSQRF